MNGLTGFGASLSQRRPAFESDQQVPYVIAKQSSELKDFTDAMVRQAVLGIFADKHETVQGDVLRVTMELIRNAQPLWRPQAGVAQPEGPAATLTLGWTTDEDDWVKYPLVMVSDGNPDMPEVQDLTRTWLGLVIELTHRCGAVRIDPRRPHAGKRFWALVSPDAR
ncbi:hypothetical protein AB0H37_12760 [Actinomadura sp. NPDC023710]|uniref:hypothetical protein n=1 Tax=Actinomadura sp. NPDC023710 TaxID=3158219 RepID=UPI003410AB43